MTQADPFGLAGVIVDGRYRVERLAGQGGFGVVYRAHHLGFDSSIALKVLRLPAHGSETRRRSRIASFQREGRMLFELSLLHPAIVRAFETGTLLGRDGSFAPYLALEWLEGLSLERELRHRRAGALPAFTLPEALALLAEPAAGLSRAHARGIAHRDIKPANLFVTERGGEQHVKILDFGIAKLVGDATETEQRSTPSPAATGSFTPLYAAPEQWCARLGPTGPWTDVHALALVCVEMLTGRPALAENSGDLQAACTDPEHRPTPAARGLRLPAAVEHVFARALSLEPRARFRDANEFWQALCRAAEWSSKGAHAFVPMHAAAGEGRGSVAQTTARSGSNAGAHSAASTTAGTASRTGYIERPRVGTAHIRRRSVLPVWLTLTAGAAWGVHAAVRDRAPAERDAAHEAAVVYPVVPPSSPARERSVPSDVQVLASAAGTSPLEAHSVAPPSPEPRASAPTTPHAPARAGRASRLAASPTVSNALATPPLPAPSLPDELNLLANAPLNLDDPALVIRK
jgi:serine/threonine protein kinase